MANVRTEPDSVLHCGILQGDFFNWSYPKNHKYGKKLKYQNWSYPKNHKYGKKLKYQKLETFYLPKKNLELLGGGPVDT